MPEEIVLSTKQELSSELSQYDNQLLSLFSSLGLPTENILVTVDERKKVIRNIEDVINILPESIKNQSSYISKYLAAVGAGLFDAALNYLWDETVKQLRSRIEEYDLQYFFDLAVPSDKRNKFSGAEDLAKIDDSELIQGAKEMGLISDIGYRLLDNIKYMRNWASAAHPNQTEITGLQLISWLETCIKEVIALPQSTVTIQIRKLLQNIKSNELSDTDAETIGNSFSELPDEKVSSLCNGFFGIYCRKDTIASTRKNIMLLLPHLWNYVQEDIKSGIGIKFSRYQINNDQEEAQLARQFLQIVNAESYLPESVRAAELKVEVEHLYRAHNAPMNNFYAEPPYARQVKLLIGTHGIPEQVAPYCVMVIVDAYLTNGNGICWDADGAYNSIINNFTQHQFVLAITSFTYDKIASKLQFSLCISQYKKLLSIAESNVTSPHVKELIGIIRSYSNSFYKLREDVKIMQKVDHLRKAIK